MLYRKPEDADEETLTVHIWRDRRTGVVLMEDWRKNGQPHRIDGPCYIWRDPVSNIMTHESWSKDGQSHREDGPAIVKRNAATGKVTFSAWYKNGEFVPRRPKAKRSKAIGPIQ
jgi:hypothetical protein